MNADWRAILKQLSERFGFEYAVAMDLRTKEVVRHGDTPSLHDNGLAFQLTADVESLETLFDSMSDRIQPQMWGQGEYSAYCLTHDDHLLVVLLGKTRGDVYEQYRLSKEIHLAFKQIMTGTTS